MRTKSLLTGLITLFVAVLAAFTMTFLADTHTAKAAGEYFDFENGAYVKLTNNKAQGGTNGGLRFRLKMNDAMLTELNADDKSLIFFVGSAAQMAAAENANDCETLKTGGKAWKITADKSKIYRGKTENGEYDGYYYSNLLLDINDLSAAYHTTEFVAVAAVYSASSNAYTARFAKNGGRSLIGAASACALDDMFDEVMDIYGGESGWLGKSGYPVYATTAKEYSNLKDELKNGNFYFYISEMADTNDLVSTYSGYGDITKYTVTWQNYDGTTLETDSVPYGATPTYDGSTPTKPTTAFTYSFNSWDSAISAATADATYTATYNNAGAAEFIVNGAIENGWIKSTYLVDSGTGEYALQTVQDHDHLATYPGGTFNGYVQCPGGAGISNALIAEAKAAGYNYLEVAVFFTGWGNVDVSAGATYFSTNEAFRDMIEGKQYMVIDISAINTDTGYTMIASSGNAVHVYNARFVDKPVTENVNFGSAFYSYNGNSLLPVLNPETGVSGSFFADNNGNGMFKWGQDDFSYAQPYLGVNVSRDSDYSTDCGTVGNYSTTGLAGMYISAWQVRQALANGFTEMSVTCVVNGTDNVYYWANARQWETNITSVGSRAYVYDHLVTVLIDITTFNGGSETWCSLPFVNTGYILYKDIHFTNANFKGTEWATSENVGYFNGATHNGSAITATSTISLSNGLIALAKAHGYNYLVLDVASGGEQYVRVNIVVNNSTPGLASGSDAYFYSHSGRQTFVMDFSEFTLTSGFTDIIYSGGGGALYVYSAKFVNTFIAEGVNYACDVYCGSGYTTSYKPGRTATTVWAGGSDGHIWDFRGDDVKVMHFSANNTVCFLTEYLQLAKSLGFTEIVISVKGGTSGATIYYTAALDDTYDKNAGNHTDEVTIANDGTATVTINIETADIVPAWVAYLMSVDSGEIVIDSLYFS